MKIVEIQFDGYVKRPENRHNTNVLHIEKDFHSAEERPNGILITKRVVNQAEQKVLTYTKLYPWPKVTDVTYETSSEDLPKPKEEPVPEASPAAPAKKAKGFNISIEDS